MPSLPKYQAGFRNLVVWREAHALALGIYKLTVSFPADEKFGLISQLRRAASSVGANIAEGSSRRSSREQSQFYSMAKSSLSEVDNFLELAHDLSYIDSDPYREVLNQVNKVAYLLSHLLHRKPSKPY